MVRDGWTCLDQGVSEVWSKPHPDKAVPWTLRLRTHAANEPRSPLYTTTHVIVDTANRLVSDLGRTEWADWQSSGDLLFAREGTISRAAIAAAATKRRRVIDLLDLNAIARPLIDLSPLRFEARPPTPLATQWYGERPRGVPLDASGTPRA